MAFKRYRFINFMKMLETMQAFHFEERALAENFILEERLSEEREDSYAQFLMLPMSIVNWHEGHRDYLNHRIRHKGTPETFTDVNSQNLGSGVDQDQFLVRVESLDRLVRVARGGDVDTTDIVEYFARFIKDKSDSEAVAIIEKFLSDYNMGYRDSRPIFAGFWGEVKELFDGDDDQWANKLRDRLGLGYLNPKGGRPIPILVLRYRVADAAPAKLKHRGSLVVPTVLDCGLSPYFCPTPQDWPTGQALDLTSGTEDDYAFTCEILHQHIEYALSHVYRVGLITDPPGRTCEEARRIHFMYLEKDFRYFEQLQFKVE
jgi:hypothetical protein